METFLKMDTMLVCLAYLLSITFYILRHIPRNLPSIKLLTTTILLTAMGLIFKSYLVYVNSFDTEAYNELMYVFATISHLLFYVTVFTWAYFVYAYTKQNEKPSVLWNILMVIPLCIMIGIHIVNFRNHMLFSVDVENNIIREGSFYAIYLLLTFYLVLIVAVLLKYRERLSNNEFYPLLIFQFIPLLGAALQYSFPAGAIDTLFIYAAFTIMMVTLHLNNSMMRYDVLTGAWKRAAFDKYTDELAKKGNTDFAVAFLDMDDFKLINDTWGHAVGDKALKKFSELASKNLVNGNFLVRFGGDEFLIFFNTKNREEIDKTLKKIEEDINKFNAGNKDKYQLKYTCKAEVFEPSVHKTISELIHYVDSEMYKEKAYKKKKRKLLQM